MGLRKDNGGVSEIVGAMLLILIVVVAAGSLAVFVSEKQQDMQEKERLEQRMENEELQIVSIDPLINSTDPTRWEAVNMTFANVNIDPAEITAIRVNDHVLRKGDIWRYNDFLDLFEKEEMSYSDHTKLKSLEQVSLNVTMDDFFEDDVSIGTNDYIKVELVTDLLNSFERTYIPPSALIRISVDSYWNGTDFAQYFILDGSGSWKGDDGYIVSWDWNVTHASNGTVQSLAHGIRTNCNAPSGTYNVTLIVTDNLGLTGLVDYRGLVIP